MALSRTDKALTANEIAEFAEKQKLHSSKGKSLQTMLLTALRQLRSDPPSWFEAISIGKRKWKYRHK